MSSKAVAPLQVWLSMGLLLGIAVHQSHGAVTIANDAVKVQLYGFVKLDAFYDNSEVYQGDWLLYSRPGGTTESKTQVFSMNARASRLGLRFAGPTVGSQTTLNALLEMDFSGGFPNSSTAARQPQVRLRHAWMELFHPVWEIRLGQDWGLIANPFPNTTDALVGAARGNLWMAFSQVKLTFKPNPFKIALSVNRPMSGNVKYDSFTNGDLDIVDDGERSGLPWFMGRLWYISQNFTLSVSSHYGKEKIADQSTVVHTVSSYSYNADLILNLGKVTLTTKVFTGTNLNTFFGGVLQGYIKNPNSVTNVESQGGWIQATYAPHTKIVLTVGRGLDDPDNSQLASGARARNLWQYASVTFKPVAAMAFMCEINHLTTDYIGRPAGKNLRLQFTSTYSF